MAKKNYYGLILAGGRGTRFWPLSRRARAKQVLRLFGERSLIQQTVDRLRPVLPPERLWILTSQPLRAEIVRQLPEVPPRQILAEPVARNTAPAIGLAAGILGSLDPDAVMGVFPSDHVIARPRRYQQFVRAAFRAAEQDRLVVLGIQPRWPETGYGYIEFPPGSTGGTLRPIPVLRFREKPNLETAREFVAAGRYYWNAGMFFWRASVILDALRRCLPKTATLLAGLPAFSHPRFRARWKEIFPRCENISIDYAVLEKAGNVVGFASDDFGWNDVGSWNAIYELCCAGPQANVAAADSLVEASTGNYIHAPGKLVALLGVNDLVVVDTGDALLIADRHRAQQVGDLVKILEQRQRHELL